MKTPTKREALERRHARVRAKVSGTAKRPRLSVYKSNTRIIAQLIDDESGITLGYVSSAVQTGKTPRERAEAAADALAKAAQKQGIKAVVFDRGGFQYVGTIKAFADSARKSGLQF